MREKNKIIIYYPSYEKGGIAKILIILSISRKNFEIFLFSQNVDKKNFKNAKCIKIIDVENPKFFPKKFKGIIFLWFWY